MGINEVTELLKTVLMWLAGIGIVIDMTPGIKIQPIRWLLGWIGKQMNRELQKDFEKLTKDFETHKIDSWRTEILDFANSAMNRRKHTKEEFDHIIKVHDDYEKYVKERGLENGQVKLAYEYIVKIYKRCLEKNSFLVVREDEDKED